MTDCYGQLSSPTGITRWPVLGTLTCGPVILPHHICRGFGNLVCSLKPVENLEMVYLGLRATFDLN